MSATDTQRTDEEQWADPEWVARLERLREQAEKEFPPAWRPDLPDQPQEIVGKLVELNPRAHTAYGPCPVVTLEGPRGGQRSVWLTHTVLENAFMRLRPQIGETVYIRCLGSKTPKNGGTPYMDYHVAVDRPEETRTADWDAIAPRHDDRGVAAQHQEPERPVFEPPPAAADDDIPF